MQEGAADAGVGDIAACPDSRQENAPSATPVTSTPIKTITFRDGATMAREPDPPIDPVIVDALEPGDKAVLIAGAKCRKSFLGLQLALSLAAGINTVAFRIHKPRRVAVCQYEIKETHYRRRIKRTLEGMGLTPNDIGDRLKIASLRGVDSTLADIGAALEGFKPELIVLDPAYKLYRAGFDENKAGDVSGLLAEIDRLAMKSNAATMIIHHDPKGASGDTKLTNRGAGSGVLARDYDCAFILTPHIQDTDAVVLSTVLRNYADPDPVCLRWEDNHFVVDHSLHPTPETAATKAAKVRRGPQTDDMIDAAKRYIDREGGRMPTVLLMEKIKSAFSVGRDKVNTTIQMLEIEHQYSRAKDAESGKWYITAPYYKPPLPELPKLPGMENQGIQEHAPRTS